MKHLISREREKSTKKYGLQRQRQLAAGTSMIFEHPLSSYRPIPITVFLFLVCGISNTAHNFYSVFGFSCGIFYYFCIFDSSFQNITILFIGIFVPPFLLTLENFKFSFVSFYDCYLSGLFGIIKCKLFNFI